MLHDTVFFLFIRAVRILFAFERLIHCTEYFFWEQRLGYIIICSKLDNFYSGLDVRITGDHYECDIRSNRLDLGQYIDPVHIAQSEITHSQVEFFLVYQFDRITSFMGTGNTEPILCQKAR
jgi:hypothetical protein